MPANTCHFARFGGVDWRADLPMPHFDSLEEHLAQEPVTVARVDPLPPREPLHLVGQAVIHPDGVRMRWYDEAVFDMTGGTSIAWSPGRTWHGQFPVSFYSTVAALTLAWRRLLALHVSTVIMADKAWLIAGPGGAGKSTLAAGLLSAGAELLADDLTIVSTDGAPLAWRGRPSMRLHPDTAAGIALLGRAEPVDDDRGKLLVRPLGRASDRGWPIGGLLALGAHDAGLVSAVQAVPVLGTTLFRPRIAAKLPGYAELKSHLLGLVRTIPVWGLPIGNNAVSAGRNAQMELALKAIDAMARLS